MHTGFSSFPNIYFGNEHVGGLDDLQSTFSIPGEMNKLLQRNEIPVEAGEYTQMDFSSTSMSDMDEEPRKRMMSMNQMDLWEDWKIYQI